MYDHVIAGFDGHDGGRDAIALAAALRPRRMSIVSAYGPATIMSRLVTAKRWEALNDEAKAGLEAVRTEMGVEADLLPIPDTSPARALHETAEDQHADLIVVGSAHHGRLGRTVLGDVGRSVLHGAPCPVVIVPRDLRDTSWAPRRIAVGYDGETEAREALHVAVTMARALGSELIVCIAWEPTTLAAGYAALPGVADSNAEDEAHAQRLVDDALAGAAGVRAQGRLLPGAPGPALRSIADEVDLVIVGSRGWGTTRRVVSGSTSDHLVHQAGTPVMVVPRPATEDTDRRARHAAGAGATAP